MGKNKLARWNELASFDNVIQPEIGEVSGKDHPIKSRWRQDIFRNDNPIVLELGCGKGEYTVGLASKFYSKNYIGIDIKGARMWRGAKTADENQLSNVAFLRTRIEFINSFFSVDEVDEIWVTFPDPHPGRRNANKRLTSPKFLNSYRSFLKHDGIVHLKTDNSELYEYTKNVALHNQLKLLMATNDLYSEIIINELTVSDKEITKAEPSNDIPLPFILPDIKTHYENMFLKTGLKINYLSFRLDKKKKLEDVTR